MITITLIGEAVLVSSSHQLLTELHAVGLIDDVLHHKLSNELANDPNRDCLQILHSSGCLTEFQSNTIRQSGCRSLILNDYILLDQLGRGGMGEVYRAVHRYLDREVALKRIRRDSANDPDMIERFRRESKLLAKLNHPNIVTAFDAGEDQGSLYLITELLPSKTVHEIVCNEGPFSESKALKFTLDICKGLNFAHQQKIIHRDIKPSNLLITNEGVVKILDLGLAKITTTPVDEATLTNAGDVLGTIDYMSPEQTLGQEATPRSDLYSLGCCLFYMLTGRSPFQHLSPLQRLEAHRSAERPRINDFRRGTSDRVDGIFQSLSANDPGERFSDATEAGKAIEQAIVTVSVNQSHPESFDTIASGAESIGSNTSTPNDSTPLVSPVPISQIETSIPSEASEQSTIQPHANTAGSSTFMWGRKLPIKYVVAIAVAVLGGLILTPWISNDLQDNSTVGETGDSGESTDESRFLTSPETTISSGSQKTFDLASRLNQGRLVYDSVTLDAPTEMNAHTGGAHFVVFSPDSATAITGGWGGATEDEPTQFNVWDLSRKKIDWTKETDGEGLLCATFLNDGRQIAIGCNDGTIEIWNVMNRTKALSINAHDGEIYSLEEIVPGLVASGGEDSRIQIWDTKTGESRRTSLAHDYDVGTLVYVSEAKLLLSGGGDGWIRGWNLETDQVTEYRETSGVSSLAYDPNSSMLFGGLVDKFIVWDFENETEEFQNDTVHRGEVWSVAVSEDGQLVATGGGRSDVHLWSVSKEELLASFYVPKKKKQDMNSVAFSPDGQWLASVCDDGKLRLWNLKPVPVD